MLLNSLFELVANICVILPRTILCHSRSPDIRLPNLLNPNERLPFPRIVPARHYLFIVRRHILPDGIGEC